MKTLDDYIQSIEDTSRGMEFMPTGFPSLDKMLDGGFMRKELIILGGFTGLGKSYLAGQIMWNIATSGYKSAYFSLEISGEMITSRLIGSLSNIKPTQIVKNKLDYQDKENADEAKMKVSAYSELIYIFDDIYLIDQIIKTVKENKFDFVVIDFIQNVVSKGDEYERLSVISLALQRLAKEVNCCILTLSQLSNSAAKGTAVEYKGSGSIAMVADLGFFITRGESHGNSNSIVLSLRKNRRGFSGCDFNLEFTMPGGNIHEK